MFSESVLFILNEFILSCCFNCTASPPSSVGRAQGSSPCGRGFEPHGGCACFAFLVFRLLLISCPRPRPEASSHELFRQGGFFFFATFANPGLKSWDVLFPHKSSASSVAHNHTLPLPTSQLAARVSHNPKVVSSILTGSIWSK